MNGLTIDGDHFRVIVNEEEQYSLWPSEKTIPDGWSDTEVTGTADECKQWVDVNWTDMRPKSLRLRMADLPSAD